MLPLGHIICHFGCVSWCAMYLWNLTKSQILLLDEIAYEINTCSHSFNESTFQQILSLSPNRPLKMCTSALRLGCLLLLQWQSLTPNWTLVKTYYYYSLLLSWNTQPHNISVNTHITCKCLAHFLIKFFLMLDKTQIHKSKQGFVLHPPVISTSLSL